MFTRIALAVVALFTLVTLAHLPFARPLVGRVGRTLGIGGHCPLGLDGQQTAEQKAASRAHFAAAHRGDTVAFSRPALGFELDASTKAEVLAWAKANGVACEPMKTIGDLSCSGVPEAVLPRNAQGAPVHALWFTFDGADHLTSLVAIRRSENVQQLSETFGTVTAMLEELAGKPYETRGDASPSALASGLLQQASAEYRFTDYNATARLTNMGKDFMLVEEYRSLPHS